MASRATSPENLPSQRNKRIEEVLVTPDMARAWMKTNEKNRRLQDKTVNLYARDMTNGDWDVNGDTLRFDVEDKLLDGQHRLAALIQADVTLPFFVIRGLPRSSQETMDVGRKRSATDTLTLWGEGNSGALSALLRRIVLWERGDRRFRDVVSISEMKAALEKHPDARRSAEIALRTSRSFRFLPASSLAMGHHLTMQIAPDEAPWFFQRIADGAIGETGHPILTLRDRAMKDVADKHRPTDVRALGYIIRAWNAYRRGESLARMVQPNDAPIPDPQ